MKIEELDYKIINLKREIVLNELIRAYNNLINENQKEGEE
jgi:hypothetical protein